jgi:hypothetical protein
MSLTRRWSPNAALPASSPLHAPLVAQAQTAPATARAKASVPLPQIKPTGAVKQMFVDGSPFIMLASKAHSSSLRCYSRSA